MGDSIFWNYEIKETTAFYCGDFQPPNYSYPPQETDCMLGVCYKDNLPDHFISPDEAYQMALNARYYYWNNIERKWNQIGENGTPFEFLKFISSIYGESYPISWPLPFENHFTFNNWKHYQILPWRELLRRHFDQQIRITDRDLMIKKRIGKR